VSPTERNLLSTGPVDKGLFRSVFAAYLSRIDLSQRRARYVSVHVTSVPNAYSIGAEAGVRRARGQRPADV
jgi:hypothetical protein